MDIAKEKSASDLTDRCRGAIWGQFIGDAACAGVEMLDQEELKRRYPQGFKGFAKLQGAHEEGDLEYWTSTKASQQGEGKDKEYWTSSQEDTLGLKGFNPTQGRLTHYGEAAFLMLQSVAELGYFTAADFGPRFVAYFSAEEYQGYLDSATKGTLQNYEAYTESRPGASYHFQGGADDDQAATVTRLAPVVVNRCLQESLLKVVEGATRVCQNNERAVAYAKCHALITKELLTGSPLREAINSAAKTVAGEGEYGKEISSIVQEVSSMLEMDVQEVTKKLGYGSQLKSCFPAALHCALKYEKDFKRAIIETANAGGDCAARAAMIGTWLGALHGMRGIPAEWVSKIKAISEIQTCVEKIVAKVGR